VTEYRRLRRAYPVIKRLGRLLDLQMAYVQGGGLWRQAITHRYLEPWNVFEHDPWPELAEAGIAWMAEQCRGDVPVYEAGVSVRRARDGQAEVVALRERGLSYRQIAKRTGCSKSQVARIIDSKGDPRCLALHKA